MHVAFVLARHNDGIDVLAHELIDDRDGVGLGKVPSCDDGKNTLQHFGISQKYPERVTRCLTVAEKTGRLLTIAAGARTVVRIVQEGWKE